MVPFPLSHADKHEVLIRHLVSCSAILLYCASLRDKYWQILFYSSMVGASEPSLSQVQPSYSRDGLKTLPSTM